MAKEREIVDKILAKTTTADIVSQAISSQADNFPEASDIEISTDFVDVFAPPKWFDKDRFAPCWVDPTDHRQWNMAMEGYFKVVNRNSACILNLKDAEKDFRDHGGVMRGDSLLLYRPKELDLKLRTYPVEVHKSTLSTLSAGKQEDGFEITHSKYKAGDRSAAERADKSGGKVEVVAYEEAGTEGFKQDGG